MTTAAVAAVGVVATSSHRKKWRKVNRTTRHSIQRRREFISLQYSNIA